MWSSHVPYLGCAFWLCGRKAFPVESYMIPVSSLVSVCPLPCGDILWLLDLQALWRSPCFFVSRWRLQPRLVPLLVPQSSVFMLFTLGLFVSRVPHSSVGLLLDVPNVKDSHVSLNGWERQRLVLGKCFFWSSWKDTAPIPLCLSSCSLHAGSGRDFPGLAYNNFAYHNVSSHPVGRSRTWRWKISVSLNGLLVQENDFMASNKNSIIFLLFFRIMWL